MLTERQRENVWDFPRPAVCQKYNGHAKIEHEGITLADSKAVYRVLETSHPPTIYFPPDDVWLDCLRSTEGESFCEWKGRAKYFDVVIQGSLLRRAAWTYPSPSASFLPIAKYLAFYPSRFECCFLDGEKVKAQEGDFYGGWITEHLVGPFKGGPGSMGW